MKAIHTVIVLCILASWLIGCRSAEKENPNRTNQDNLEAVLDGPVPEVLVDLSTHVRIENHTRSVIVIRLGSTTEKIEPGSYVFIPEEYDDESGFVSVRFAQLKEGEWKWVFASKWYLSEKWIESYVANETTSGKFTIFGTRDPIEGIKSTSAPGRQPPDREEPRRRVILEGE